MATAARKIITFYSYKGGTGRSMALANAAWILACAGKRVLVIDWDLEAPGLHRYFRPFLVDPDLASSEGIIDFFTAYCLSFLDEDADAIGDAWFDEHADLDSYTTSLEWSFPGEGGIDFVPAGKQGPEYSTRVNTFDWKNLYDRLRGTQIVEALRSKLARDYEFVLIDSRTGVSDTSGICTLQLPDVLVPCFTLNNQSIEGVRGVLTSVAKQRGELRPISIFPMAMRVDLGESDRLASRRNLARRTLGAFLPFDGDSERQRYWDETEVLAVPIYSYEEVLAPFRDSGGAGSVLEAYRHITRYLTGVEASSTSLQPSDDQRKRVLDLFSGASATLEESLATKAEQFYRSLTRSDQLSVQRVVINLIELVAPGIDRLRSVRQAALIAPSHLLIAMSSAGLIRVRRDSDSSESQGSFELADRALLSSWPRLVDWLSQSRAPVLSPRTILSQPSARSIVQGDAPLALRDANTPDEVIVNVSSRRPEFDPTAGVPVPGIDRRGQPRNRLVVLGDSLSQGFQSGAIFNTRLSWPMIVAHELGCDEEFRFPRYDAEGGLPLNIELLVRMLEQRFQGSIDAWEVPSALFEARSWMARVEAYWESEASFPRRTAAAMHNLAVYGWDVRDLLDRNWTNLRASLDRPRNDVFSQLVQNHNERAALRVYASLYGEESVLDGARRLGDEGCEGVQPAESSGHGIETLVVFIGANNALGSVTDLRVKWSGPGYDTLAGKGGYNVWRPSHFRVELAALTGELKRIRARHVILATVPHVTIAPLARGVAQKTGPGSRYFPFYTRPWISDAQFEPKDDPNITANEARAIDSAIDQYNDDIVRVVREARQEGRDWYVLEVAGLLDRLASRRYIEDPHARPDWWTPYELPPTLSALTPRPDSHFFASNEKGRIQGGLFSLDGVHPTTIGYGIIAQEVINIMQRAGVKFYHGDYRYRSSLERPTERTGPVLVDFERLIRLDTLISHPPTSLSKDLKIIGWLDETLDLFRRLNPFS